MRQNCELGERFQHQAKHQHSRGEWKYFQVSPVSLGQHILQPVSLMEGKIVHELSYKRKGRVSGTD